MKLELVAANPIFALRQKIVCSRNENLRVEFACSGRGEFLLVGLPSSWLAAPTGGYDEEHMEISWHHIAYYMH